MGEGTFGRVVECWDRKYKSYCAIKVVRNVKKYRDAAMIEVHSTPHSLPRHYCYLLWLNPPWTPTVRHLQLCHIPEAALDCCTWAADCMLR